MTTIIENPGSFRDPSGFVFSAPTGEIYRWVSASYRQNYEKLMSSGLYEKLVYSGLLVSHLEIAPENFAGSPYRILSPERIPFISYPYEWCFSQLKAAALLTLRIQEIALEHGMSLKDASAFNVQFVGTRPIWIDTLSFEIYDEGKPWVAYRQFCQHFLAPLALICKTDYRLSQLFRTHLDGIPLDLTRRLLPFSTWFRPSLAFHIHIHSLMQGHYQNKSGTELNQVPTRKNLSKNSILGMLQSLRSAVENLSWKVPRTDWSNYYGSHSYSSQAETDKQARVGEWLGELKPKSVWDLGANTGKYSTLAAHSGANVLAFDLDPAAVEKNYQACHVNSETKVLPLCMDLMNPSSDSGWAHRERTSLEGRGPAEMVLALALIHHLAIGNNVPLTWIARYFSKLGPNLIIEFVPKSDPQVIKLLAIREDIFEDYTQESFEQKFGEFYQIEKTAKVPDSDRVLYRMRLRLFNNIPQ